MIKPQELRIGNWFLNPKGEPEQVEEYYSGYINPDVSIMYNDIEGYKEGDINAIPLTEEWLTKFGFVKDSAPNCYEKAGFVLFTKNEANDIHVPYFPCGKHIVIVEHVHQLQNLFYSITYLELSI